MDFKTRLKTLNQQQLEAVNYIDGPLVVRAGPGTGKTEIITMRIENILNNADVLPENILCLTFTESAAENMRQRLYKAIGKPARKVNFYTFHGFGSHLITKLNDYSDKLNLTKPIEEIAVFEIIEQLLDKLDHRNPLSRKDDDGFYYIQYINSVFGWLKKSGLSTTLILEDVAVAEKFFNLSSNNLSEAFSEKTSKKRLPIYQELFTKLKSHHQKQPSKSGTELLKQLATAIEDMELEDSSKPITAWKGKWTTKNYLNKTVYADQKNLPKFKAAVLLLDDYQKKLESRGYYDYDDMILRATDALETNVDFKLNVQEQYQYVLVDEYQDTNGAQNKLLELLCDNPVYEGSPNLMVVGDPDQAIFGFQGADSSLLTNFSDRWSTCRQVTLIKNYRSGQKLLDFSKTVLDRANDEADNVLLEAGKFTNKTQIEVAIAKSADQSYCHISNQIKGLISSGVEPTQVAIISKEHSQLTKILPFLTQLEIPVSYERDNNILDQPKIIEIIDLANLTYAMSSGSSDQINALLAKVLSAEYWNLSTDQWWGIALESRLNYKSWSETLESSSDERLSSIWRALKIIAKLSQNSSFELIFNYLIGAKPIELSEGESFTMPWLAYNTQQNDEIEGQFIVFISQFNKLKMFFNNWLDYNSEKVTLSDFIKFIKLIDKDYIKLVDHSTISSSSNAIALTTAYKAKGEEWDYVFILDCNNRLWAKVRGGSRRQFALPIAYEFIEPASYLAENIVKPFYVAITRAKKTLYLNNYLSDDKGVATEYLDWIDSTDQKQSEIPSSNKALITSFFNQDWQSKLLEQKNDYKEAMKPILDNFKLSATHLNSYLEIVDNGTNSFIFNNLLRIPRTVGPKLIYGTAMHESINHLHKINANEKRLLSTLELTKYFDKQLKNTALTDQEIEFYTKKGHDELKTWYKHHLSDFNDQDLSEYNVSLTYLDSGDQKLTGEIDLLKFEENSVAKIIDYKSTAPPAKYSKLLKDPKEYRYRRQLLFYKVLLTNINYQRSSKLISINSGAIEFLTPNESGSIVDHQIEFENKDVNRMKQLIAVVWKKIMDLQIIDSRDYDKTVKGMIQLEDDLIAGKI